MTTAYSPFDAEASKPAITIHVAGRRVKRSNAQAEIAALDLEIARLVRRRRDLMRKVDPEFAAQVAKVMDAVTSRFYATEAEILGRDRHARVADARQAFMALLSELSGRPDHMIAKATNRERSLVPRARRVVAIWLTTDRVFRARYVFARAALGLTQPTTPLS